MSSPASQGRRRSQAKPNTEDHALNLIASEAEARLAAKRAARAEARSIRMKELERMQHEADEKMDREYQRSLLSDDAVKQRSVRVADKIQARIAAVNESEMNGPVSQELQIKTLQENLREMSEKFKQAMVSNAQLDNEKQALSYQVDCLKDRLEDAEERIENLKQEILDKTRDFNRVSRENKNNIEELTKMREQLILRDKLLEEHGIPTDGSEQPDMSQSELSSSRINESLQLDSTDLDQSGFNKSRESSRRSSVPDDRESLLEQIKMLKEKVSDLRRDPEMDDSRLRDAENLQMSGEQTERVAGLADQDLERSETFEDITDEAIEIHDRGRAGMIINNNERNEDYDVIEQNLQQGEVRCFEDRSYENSYMSESITDSMMASYASTVVTTESIESERPLEISMTAALEEANGNAVADNHSHAELVSNTQKQSEKDLNDYDIVESTHDAINEQADDAAEIMQSELETDDISSSRITKVPADVDDNTEQQSSENSGIAQLHNQSDGDDESIPNDMVNIDKDEGVDSIPSQENPSLLRPGTEDYEGAASDIEDVEMPVPDTGPETPQVESTNEAVREESETRNAVEEQGSALDLVEHSDQDLTEATDIVIEQETKGISATVEMKDEISSLPKGSVTEGLPDLELNRAETKDDVILADSNLTSELASNAPDDGIQARSIEKDDLPPSPELKRDSLEKSDVLDVTADLDHKDDEDAFLNIEPEDIEPEEAFFDARSEIQSDILKVVEDEKCSEQQNESNDNFEEVEVKDADIVKESVVKTSNEMDDEENRVSIDEESISVRESDGNSDSLMQADDAATGEIAASTEDNDITADTDSGPEALRQLVSSQDKEKVHSGITTEEKSRVEESCIGDDIVHIENITDDHSVPENSDADSAMQPDKPSDDRNKPCREENDLDQVSSPDAYVQGKDQEPFENVEMTDVISSIDMQKVEEDVVEKESDLAASLKEDEQSGLVPKEELDVKEGKLAMEIPPPDYTGVTDEGSSNLEAEVCDHRAFTASPSADITVIVNEEQKPEENKEEENAEEVTTAPKDKLLEAYETRQKLADSSPDSQRKGASPQPVPKKRKKNKKKKKKGKEVVKVVDQEAAVAFPHLDDSLQETGSDNSVVLEADNLEGGHDNEAVSEHEKSAMAQGDLPEGNLQDSNLDSTLEQEDTPKDDNTPDSNRRLSTSSASGFSDDESGGKSSKKDKKKSKKDSKKDGCKNQ